MTIYEKIDADLENRGMSRRQLALNAGIAPSTLQSTMERGRNMTFEMLLKIAATLNRPISYFADEVDLPYLDRDGEPLKEEAFLSLPKSKAFASFSYLVSCGNYKIEYENGQFLFIGLHGKYSISGQNVNELLDNSVQHVEWLCAKLENELQKQSKSAVEDLSKVPEYRREDGAVIGQPTPDTSNNNPMG